MAENEEVKQDQVQEEPKAEVNKNEQASVDKQPDKVSEEPKKEVKTFTQEQVNKIVKERLEREMKKAKAEQAEAEKLAKMNEAEKQQYELDQWKSKAEQAEKKLEALQMRSEARRMLADKGINVSDEQLDLVVSDNAEMTSANIDKLATLVAQTKEDQRKELLAGKTPSVGGKATMTKEEIMAIKDPIARRRAIAENEELFI